MVEGWAALEAGKFREAVPFIRKATTMGAPPFVTAYLAYALGAAGDRAGAMAALETLKKMSQGGQVLPFNLALVYLGLGDHARALDNLEQALRGRFADDGVARTGCHVRPAARRAAVQGAAEEVELRRLNRLPTVDPLSDVLRAVRLTGAYFYMVEATHPWSVLTVEATKLVPRVHPAAEHLISYHILTSGSCWGGVAGDEQILMQPGDAIVFPHGDANLMSSVPNPRRRRRHARGDAERYPDTVIVGAGPGAKATFVCGFLGCDLRPYNPLLSALPRQILARGVAGDWLAEFPDTSSPSRTSRAREATRCSRGWRS